MAAPNRGDPEFMATLRSRFNNVYSEEGNRGDLEFYRYGYHWNPRFSFYANKGEIEREPISAGCNYAYNAEKVLLARE